MFFGGEIESNTAALIAVERLHHHRQADFEGGFPRILGRANGAAFGHREPHFAEQAAGEIFVLDDVLGDRAGQAGGGGKNLPLFAAPTELDQTSLGKSADGNPPADRGVHHGAGARPEAQVIG